jgi:integrase
MGKLTAASVRGLKEPGRHADGHGLDLIVDKAGRRYWTYRYQQNGRSRTMSLGSADAIGLAEARARHAEARAQVLKGSDPLAAREQARAAAQEAAGATRRVPTLSDCAEAYVAAHGAGWRGPRVADQWRHSLRDHVFPRLGNKPVGTLTTDDLLAVLEPIWKRLPQTAAKVRSRIENLLDYATARGWRSGPNPALWRGGLKTLLPSTEKVRATQHYAALPWQEAPALLAKLDAVNTMSGRALAFMIHTAVRSGEVRGARWDEIDLDAATWTLPASRMKAGKEHRVALSGAALAILASLHAVRTEEPRVFLGKGGRPMADVTLKDVLRRIGYGHVTVHGMRSTFRDWCADTGQSSDAAEAALAHVAGSAVVRAYQRSDLLDQRRPLMEAWASYLLRAPAEVIPLRAAG